MLAENEARAAVLAAAKGMLGRGLTSGTSGNVSARLAGGTIVITPSGLPYQDMGPGDLVVITMAGEPVSRGRGGLAPSSEYQLHTACYQAFREIGAVLHSHPPYASMFAAARQPVPAVIDEAVIFLGGEIPVASYAISGSAQVGENAVAVLGRRASALLASHGLVTVAATPAQALHHAVVSEHCAQVAWGTRALGGHIPLPSSTLETFGAAYRRGRASSASGRVLRRCCRRIRAVAARTASTRTAPTTTPMAMAQPRASAMPTAGSSGSDGGSLPVTLVQATVATLRATNAAPRAATVLSALLAPSPRLSDMHPP